MALKATRAPLEAEIRIEPSKVSNNVIKSEASTPCCTSGFDFHTFKKKELEKNRKAKKK